VGGADCRAARVAQTVTCNAWTLPVSVAVGEGRGSYVAAVPAAAAGILVAVLPVALRLVEARFAAGLPLRRLVLLATAAGTLTGLAADRGGLPRRRTGAAKFLGAGMGHPYLRALW
jgi:hypothetical protein